MATESNAVAPEALLDLTFDAIFVREFESDRIQFWNRGAENLYGFSRDEAIGRVSHDLLQTSFPTSAEDARETLLRTGRWEGELVHTTRDGAKVVVASRWALQTGQGKPVATLETNTDITERKGVEEAQLELLARERQARAQAEEARQRLALLANASALLASSLDYEVTLTSLARAVVPRIADWCAVHLVDEEGTVRQIAITHSDPNKVALARELERRYPYDPNAPAGVPQVLRTGKPELVSEISDELLEELSPEPDLLRIVRELGLKSSMVVPLIARSRKLGAITLAAAESGRRYTPEDVALAEILARRAALAVDNARLYREAQLVAAERSAILSQLTEGVILCDTTGTVTFMNEAAERLYGRNMVGHSLAEYASGVSILDARGKPYSADALPLQRALCQGELTIDAEARLRRPDGTEVIVQRNATPVMAEDGSRLGAVLTVRDVTAQRTLEQQKDAFLSAAAHDLKTPLTSIQGLAQILQRRVTREQAVKPDQLLDGLVRIEQNASRMTSLINELLDLSRHEMGEGLQLNRRPMDLVSLVSNCVAEFQALTESHPIVVESSIPELVGTWDAERLERVFANLLSNATKYSTDHTPITVTVKKEVRDGVDWAIVSVQDRGIGIPREDLPHIFERFHRAVNATRRTSGTGIGLAGAKQIVDQHGGAIEVTSEEGVGSTFTVRLPLNVGDDQAQLSQQDREEDVRAG